MNELQTETKEMKSAQNDFASTFQAFKDANDERLAALEQKQGDGLLTDKVDRINAALDAQSKRIENLAITATRPAIGGEAINTEAKSAWSSYIRTGDGSELASLEGKSLSTSVDAEGGYVAPAETESRIDRALLDASPFRRISTVRRVGRGQFRKPVSAGGAESGWAGVFRDAESDALARTAFFEQSVETYRFILPDFGIIEGPFLLTSLSYAGTYQGEATYELTLMSAGAPSFSAL